MGKCQGVAEEAAPLGTAQLLEGRTLYSKVGNILGQFAIFVVLVGLRRTWRMDAP